MKKLIPIIFSILSCISCNTLNGRYIADYGLGYYLYTFKPNHTFEHKAFLCTHGLNEYGHYILKDGKLTLIFEGGKFTKGDTCIIHPRGISDKEQVTITCDVKCNNSSDGEPEKLEEVYGGFIAVLRNGNIVNGTEIDNNGKGSIEIQKNSGFYTLEFYDYGYQQTKCVISTDQNYHTDWKIRPFTMNRGIGDSLVYNVLMATPKRLIMRRVDSKNSYETFKKVKKKRKKDIKSATSK